MYVSDMACTKATESSYNYVGTAALPDSDESKATFALRAMDPRVALLSDTHY
jgi:hypothetical protein